MANARYGVVRGVQSAVSRVSGLLMTPHDDRVPLGRFGSSLLNGWLRGGEPGGRGRRNGLP